MKKLSILFLALLPSLALAGSIDEIFPTRAENEKKMQEVSDALALGAVPALPQATQYYQGLCLTSYSAARNPVTYSAVLALGVGADGRLALAYSLGTGPFTPYTAADLKKLGLLYTLKSKPYTAIASEKGGEFLDFIMAEPTKQIPAQIHAFLSVDQADASKMSFVAALFGYYCRLDRIQ